MAIIFPRHMPSALYQSEEIVDQRNQSYSITGAGTPNVAELAPMTWHATWSGQTSSPAERQGLESWAASLAGGRNTFRGEPKASKFPASYATTGWGSLAVSGAPFTGAGVLAATATRTNLCLRSAEFDNASWTKDTGVTVGANVALAVDDTITADRVTLASVAANAGIYQTVTVTANTQYTFSVYVKLATLSSSNFAMAIYNVTGSAFIATSVPASAALSTSAYAHLTYTFTTPAGCTSIRVYPFAAPVAGISGVLYLWGAQLEAGGGRSSYVPTTSAAVTFTPSADEITISSLPPGLILSVGDWLSFPVGSRQRLFKVTEAGVANATGNVNVGIEPPRPASASNGVAVRLERPWCDMVLLTPPKRVITNYQMGTFEIEGLQVLI